MSKDAKAALKEARELIKQKEYKEAIKKCKIVLKEDKTNYVALVLLGAAMQEVDDCRIQAPLALKKAAEIQPSNPLAWQGLVAFYEREPDNAAAWVELVPAYCKLLNLDSDPAKYNDFLNKATDFTLRLKEDTILAQFVMTLQQLSQISSVSRIKVINSALASLLTQYPNLPNEYSELLEKVLAIASKDTSAENRQEYYKKYLKILYNSGKLTALLSEAAQMHELYCQDVYPLEWICRVYSEESVLNGSCDGVEITPFFEALLALNTESSMALMAKAVNLYQKGSLIESRDHLNRVVSLKPQWLHAWIIMAEVHLKLNCSEEARNAAIQSDRLLKDNNVKKFKSRVDLLLIEALVKSSEKKHWELAVKKCKEIFTKDSSNKLLLLLTRAYVYLNDPEASALLTQLEAEPETRVEATVLRAISLKNRNTLDEAADVLGSALESTEAWLTLGKIHWEMADYSHSLMAFLKGVHANPYNWECLVYLGHYYREHGNDLEKSRKCYQKALQINPSSEQAGIGLSIAYRLLKNGEANMRLLQRVTMHGSGPKWAWLQLGLQHLDQGEATQAINALRIVIRADPNDNHTWESLADAYWARGAHTSALKSYQRALELSPGSLYPMIQIANIKLMLAEYLEAKEGFEHVLSQEHHYIPALKGLAETHIGLAREYAKKQLLGRARDNAQLAVNHLTVAIVERSDFSCLWKLLADASYQVALLPKKYCFLEVVPGLVKANSSEDRVTITRSEIFALSSRSTCRALNLSEDSSLLWHDLASCCLAKLRLDSAADSKALADRALAAAKQAVRLSPSSWSHWNLLGVICMLNEIKNYALAQHCFVMSIDKEQLNAVTWANLGTLYLHLGDPYRANEAFSRAQRADPAFINSWVGQALIAEKMNRREAMDLFRHATQLGYHGQAALGYTHWVLSTLLDPEAKKDPLYTYTIENMHAVPVATDAINWYIEHIPEDPHALNAQGLLLERKQLYNPAAVSFSTALQLTTKDTEKDLLHVNLARVLVQLGRFDEAVQLCQSVKNADFNSHCQLAMSLFKAKRYEESYGAYEAASHWLASEGSDKAHILCAMAAMAYMFQGVDDAKTLLFLCIRIQPPIVAGLLAAAALGLLHGDTNLTALVLKELEPYRDHPEYRNHITLLATYTCHLENDRKGAVRVLSKAAHRHPGDVGSWVGLVRLLADCDPKTSSNSARKALFLGRNSCANNVALVACVSSLSELVSGCEYEGLRSTEKTIYSFPGVAESWANLVVALLPRSKTKDSKPSAHWLTVLISIIRRKMHVTRPMAQWLSNNERKASLLADQLASKP